MKLNGHAQHKKDVNNIPIDFKFNYKRNFDVIIYRRLYVLDSLMIWQLLNS